MFVVFCTIIILYTLYIFIFMTYSTSYCHFDKLWIHGMYVSVPQAFSPIAS